MCVGTPKIPQAKQFQASKAPVFRDSGASASASGRKGTILTGGSGVVESSPTQKKTLLGQ